MSQSVIGSSLPPTKLDGVGPVDNRPFTNKLHHFVQKNKKTCDTWHVTCDMWHVMTCDTWHVTHDMWLVVWGNILSKFQLPSSYGLWFMISWRLGGKGWLTHSLTQSINDEGVCRTAPATPGLLIRIQLYPSLTHQSLPLLDSPVPVAPSPGKLATWPVCWDVPAITGL